MRGHVSLQSRDDEPGTLRVAAGIPGKNQMHCGYWES